MFYCTTNCKKMDFFTCQRIKMMSVIRQKTALEAGLL